MLGFVADCNLTLTLNRNGIRPPLMPLLPLTILMAVKGFTEVLAQNETLPRPIENESFRQVQIKVQVQVAVLLSVSGANSKGV